MLWKMFCVIIVEELSGLVGIFIFVSIIILILQKYCLFTSNTFTQMLPLTFYITALPALFVHTKKTHDINIM